MRRLILTVFFFAFGVIELVAQSTPVELSRPVFVPSEPTTPTPEKKPKKHSKNGFLRAVVNTALNVAVDVAESKVSGVTNSNSGTSNTINPTSGNYGVPASNNISPTSGNYGTLAANSYAPVLQMSKPVELSTPVNNAFTSVKQLSTPVTNAFTPVKQLSKPVELSTPIKQLSTPVVNSFTSVELSTPVTNAFTPVQQMSKPVELSTPITNAFTAIKQISNPIELSTPVQLSTPIKQMSSPVKLGTPVQLSTAQELSKKVNLGSPINLSSSLIGSLDGNKVITNISNNLDELKIIVGRGLGTTVVDEASNWYLQQYIQSVKDGHPNQFYLAGVGATSLWTTDNYLKTLNAFSLATMIPERVVVSGGEGLGVLTTKSNTIIESASKIENGYSKIGSTKIVGESYLKSLGGESQVYFKTSEGGRYVDQFVNGVAHESKVGYTTLTKDIQLQITKDAELIAEDPRVKKVVWNFFKSPVTGEIGASQPLLRALKDAGIEVKIIELHK